MPRLQRQRDDVPATARTTKQRPFRLVGGNNAVDLASYNLVIPWGRIDNTDTGEENRDFRFSWLMMLLYWSALLDRTGAKQTVEPVTDPAN